jgi:hypothetical protein
MGKTVCPICGDPGPFVLWIDKQPPLTCPDDPSWPERSLNSICDRQLRSAEQAAARRRITPDGFDASGNIIPSEAARVWQNYVNSRMPTASGNPT